MALHVSMQGNSNLPFVKLLIGFSCRYLFTVTFAAQIKQPADD